MGKKKRKEKKSPRKQRGQGQEPPDGEDSDNLSEISNMSFRGVDIDPAFKEKYIGDMQDNVDALLEKQTGKEQRAKSFVVIASLLSKSVWKDWAVEHQPVLKHAFLDSIKKGDAKEQIACCKCLSLFLITLGDGLSRPFSEALGEALLAPLKDPETSATPSQIAVNLGVVALLGLVNGEEKSKRTIAELLFPVWTDDNQKIPVRAGALEAWLLAVADLKTKEKGTKLFSQTVPLLVNIIEMEPNQETLDLFIAAGRAVSLLYEAYFWHNLNGGDESEEEEGEEQKLDEDDNPEPYFYNENELPDIEYVQGLLDAMSTQSSKGQKKETVKVQRKHFRGFSRAVADGTAPEVTVKLKGQVFTIEGWPNNTIWDFMRKAISGGLQAHLLSNSWFQDLVGIDGSVFVHSPNKKSTEKAKVQSAERRVQGKETFLQRNKARDKKRMTREVYD